MSRRVPARRAFSTASRAIALKFLAGGLGLTLPLRHGATSGLTSTRLSPLRQALEKALERLSRRVAGSSHLEIFEDDPSNAGARPSIPCADVELFAPWPLDAR